MSTEYGFEREICRKGTNCIKWDRSRSKFGEEGILPLWIADTDFAVLPEVTEAVRRRLEHPVFGYSVVPPELFTGIKDWFGKRHGLSLSRDWIVPGSGVITAISYCVQTFSEPGDGVLIQPPVYDPFTVVINGTGRRVEESPLVFRDNTYFMDYEDLERKFKSGVRMMVLCNPHNPVGRVWSREELARLKDLCVRYGVFVISDEIHCDFGLFGHAYTSVLAFPELYGQAAACTAPGKTFNLSGLNISAMLVPDGQIRKRVAERMRSAWLMGPDLLAAEAAAAAYLHGGDWMDAQLAYLEKNSLLVQERLAAEAPHIRPAAHEGTFLMWLDFSELGLSHEELVGELVHTWKLGLNSGTTFGRGGEAHMRLNIGCPEKTLNEALDRLVRMHRAHAGGPAPEGNGI